ncbi:flagellar biosynthesis protein FlhB [Aerophototrophica crusticola]|uniref:Flagellar biosynthetic protein FlhB n=1 Tax=Aerophototrophica crusticola TaxID=1709002 RepID=A0A858R6H0_9PROT|nr:flagellar biosynthesis protein FlhB [Rhodospirillaceae bacterium B3]
MAEDQDEDSKTEDPTGKKLADARSRGQVPKTQEMNHLMVLGAGLVLVIGILPWSFGHLSGSLVPFIERPHQFATDLAGVGRVLSELALDIFIAMIVPLLVLAVAVVAGNLLQVGWLFSTESVFSFDLNKLNPLAALGQKFSMRNLVEFLKSLAKLLVVGVVVTWLLAPLWGSVDHFIAMSLPDLIQETKEIAGKLIFAVLIVLSLLAGADYMYQRFEFMKQMRMTKQEVKDEFKQSEGDPLIKGKIRQLRMERARNRMMANVPTADVVVTNPTHFAVALKYDGTTMSAPKVVAKGVDNLAFRIREVAEEHDIPIVENPPLARALYATAEVDEEIPADHYKAVAQVISYVFKLKRKTIPS